MRFVNPKRILFFWKKNYRMSDTLLAVIQGAPPFPLLGKNYGPDDYAPVDLSVEQEKCTTFGVHTFTGLERYIAHCHQQKQARVLYGGYLENRALYQRSSHFTNPETARTIHLGLDLWEKAGTPVFAPLAGRVHSFQYNDKPLDYGGTIILEHQLQGLSFHTLYGHLSKDSLSGLQKRQPIRQGQEIARFGAPEENGGWVPHLHFQIVIDIEGMQGDYPGVCAKKDVKKYRNNCPDPAVFLV